MLRTPAASCSGASTIVSGIVQQFGFAMIPACSNARAPLTSGTTSGMPSSKRNADDLSMYIAPASAAMGTSSRCTAPQRRRSRRRDRLPRGRGPPPPPPRNRRDVPQPSATMRMSGYSGSPGRLGIGESHDRLPRSRQQFRSAGSGRSCCSSVRLYQESPKKTQLPIADRRRPPHRHVASSSEKASAVDERVRAPTIRRSERLGYEPSESRARPD